MTEFDNIPDDFWRKAFSEADETPPPRVWDAIEHQLDESRQSGIIPLWASGVIASRPLVWGTGMAAAVALLLAGWWLTGNQSTDQVVAHNTHVEPIPYQPSEKAANNVTEQAIQPSAESSVTMTRRSSALSHKSVQPKWHARTATDHNESGFTADHTPSALALSATPRPSATAGFTSSDRALSASEPASPTNRFTSESETGRQQELTSLTSPTFEQIASRAIYLRGPGAIHRIVWVRPADADMDALAVNKEERTRSKRDVKPVWASLALMPGSFNPAVSIRSAPMVAANSFVNNRGSNDQASVSSQAELSMAYQAGAGVQLNEHWSVESGVGYLVGRSTVGSPGQMNAYSSAQIITANQAATVGSNLYVDALRSSVQTHTNTKASADILAANNAYLNQATYDAQGRQLVTNNYQFVQVPLQVGYQLRPRKRLGLALLGGFLTNIFVKNTVSDALVITSSDGVYRPLALAANIGARLRFRPSPRWSASLAGLYQPTLGSATQSAAQVQSHPTAAGMSFGVDYHF